MMVALRDQYSRTLVIPGIPTLTGIVLLTHALSLLYAATIHTRYMVLCRSPNAKITKGDKQTTVEKGIVWMIILEIMYLKKGCGVQAKGQTEK